MKEQGLQVVWERSAAGWGRNGRLWGRQCRRPSWPCKIAAKRPAQGSGLPPEKTKCWGLPGGGAQAWACHKELDARTPGPGCTWTTQE